MLRPARPTRSRPSRSRSVCAPKPSARPYSVNRLGFPSPARPVPEQRPGQVSVLANAHILGHGDDAVQRSNHVCRGEETLPALTPRVRSSLARNRKHELCTSAHLKPRPPKSAAHPICAAKAPPSPRPAPPPTGHAPHSSGRARPRKREEVWPRACALSRPALLHTAMPRRKSASGGSTAAGPSPGRQAVLSRFFRSEGSLRSSASSTEPAEKVEYGSAAPPAST